VTVITYTDNTMAYQLSHEQNDDMNDVQEDT